MERARDFLKYVLEALCDEPEKIEVEASADEMGVLLTVKVARNDMGKIIGREGATAKAVRTILWCVGQRENAHISMKIIEPEGNASDFGRQRAKEAFQGITM
jgi:predicted RNA-binding protein YlqC (UPF0109 family)